MERQGSHRETGAVPDLNRRSDGCHEGAHLEAEGRGHDEAGEDHHERQVGDHRAEGTPAEAVAVQVRATLAAGRDDPEALGAQAGADASRGVLDPHGEDERRRERRRPLRGGGEAELGERLEAGERGRLVRGEGE